MLGISRDILDKHIYRLADEDQSYLRKYTGTYYLRSRKNNPVFEWEKINYNDNIALNDKPRNLPNYVNVFLPAFGADMVEINYGKTGLFIYAHGYTQPGLFTVTLKVSNTKGENAIVTTQVMPVLPPNQLPLAKFNCNSPSPYVVYCSDAGSSDADGSIISRKLTFDDNSEEYLSVTTSTRHQFATSGAHSVTLTVIDNDGGVGTLTQSIDVKSNTNPTASFTCSTPGPQRLSCYSTSRDPDSGDMIGTLDWEYGDGGSTSGVATAFDHTYSTSGSFSVSLTVHDQYGGSNTVTQSFATLENQAPLASVNCFVTTGSTYQCDGSASDSDGTIASQTFTVDGVSLGSGSSIQYEFTNGGDHEVVFTATDDLGKSTSVSKTIKIDKPIADMVCSIVENLKVQCKPNLSMNMSNIVFIKYVYDGFYEDDGNVSEFTFSHFGDHKVEILVLSNDKTFATQTININIPKIHLPPKADFKYVVIDSLNASFNGLNSLFQERDVSKYEWSFGDGSTQESTDGMVNHNYTSTGYYDVVLTVTDSLGEKNSLSKKIYIYNPEVPDPGEAGDSIIEGIDSDNDGVRDDIQRWISFEVKDNYRLKTALKKLASIYQSNNLHYMDISYSKSLLLQKTKIEFCIKGLLNDDLNFNHITSFVQYLNYDTEDRARIRFKIMKNLSGNDNLAYPTNQHDQLLYCSEQGI